MQHAQAPKNVQQQQQSAGQPGQGRSASQQGDQSDSVSAHTASQQGGDATADEGWLSLPTRLWKKFRALETPKQVLGVACALATVAGVGWLYCGPSGSSTPEASRWEPKPRSGSKRKTAKTPFTELAKSLGINPDNAPLAAGVAGATLLGAAGVAAYKLRGGAKSKTSSQSAESSEASSHSESGSEGKAESEPSWILPVVVLLAVVVLSVLLCMQRAE